MFLSRSMESQEKSIEVDLWTSARPGQSQTAYVTYTDRGGKATFVGVAPGTYYSSSNAITFPKEYGNASESWGTSPLEIVQGRTVQKNIELTGSGPIANPTGAFTQLDVKATDSTGKPVVGIEISPQLTAFFTSAIIFVSSVAVNCFSAKATGHMEPSSRFATSLKPNVAYLALNFPAYWKKQTILSAFAYAGNPYHVFGVSEGAFFFMRAWSRVAIVRSGSDIFCDCCKHITLPLSLTLI